MPGMTAMSTTMFFMVIMAFVRLMGLLSAVSLMLAVYLFLIRGIFGGMMLMLGPRGRNGHRLLFMVLMIVFVHGIHLVKLELEREQEENTLALALALSLITNPDRL